MSTCGTFEGASLYREDSESWRPEFASIHGILATFPEKSFSTRAAIVTQDYVPNCSQKVTLYFSVVRGSL